MRKFVVVGVLLSLFLAACASSKTETGPCAQRKGTYRLNATERSWTCGKYPEQIVTIDSQPTTFDAPCTGTIKYSADNCRVTLDGTCPEPGIGKGYTSTTTGTFDWSRDAADMTGTFQFVLTKPDGTTECQSTYDANEVRQ